MKTPNISMATAALAFLLASCDHHDYRQVTGGQAAVTIVNHTTGEQFESTSLPTHFYTERIDFVVNNRYEYNIEVHVGDSLSFAYHPVDHFLQHHTVLMEASFMQGETLRLTSPPYSFQYAVPALPAAAVYTVSVQGTADEGSCHLQEASIIRLLIPDPNPPHNTSNACPLDP